MPTIFVIGSANTDMVIQTDTHPKPGQTVLGNNFMINPGGKGANQAVAASRLGGEVVFVAKLGNDLFGNQAIQHFTKEGIDTKFIFFEEKQPSGVALITLDAKGENTIVVAAGANQYLLKKEIDLVEDSFQADDFVLFQLEIPIKTVYYGVKLAQQKNVQVILNPAPAQQLEDDILKGLFLITPNETEALELTGIDVKDVESAHLAAEILLSKGVKNVIITLGANGAFYMSGKEAFHVKTDKVSAIDTTAAGDCFNGALAVSLSKGMEWKSAIEFACKAASLSVTKLGAQASMPFLNDLE